MSKIKMEENRLLHREVVRGIVRIVKFLGTTTQKSHSFGDMIKLGKSESCSDANMWICEFVKDGIRSLTKETIEQTIQGDYTWAWEMTNNFLVNFGHEPVDPEQVES